MLVRREGSRRSRTCGPKASGQDNPVVSQENIQPKRKRSRTENRKERTDVEVRALATTKTKAKAQ